jgi:hypothetical protein
VGAVAGSDIHGVPDGAGSDTFAYVTEYNAYTNGSKCSHDVSPQCSGVFLSKDGGMTFEHIDWQGTLRFQSRLSVMLLRCVVDTVLTPTPTALHRHRRPRH